jgi:predicted enzyme related to lactoylglutathione lyase
MNRAFVSLLANDVEKRATFYEHLLGMTRHADFGWFVILTHMDMPGHELGILDQTHSTVPRAASRAPGGVLMTFVVEDVALAHAKAKTMGAEIIEAPRDLPYGQRRLLLRDPEGALVDVSSPIPT